MKTGTTLRVMAVRGNGNENQDLAWTHAWRAALAQSISRWDPEQHVEFDFMSLDVVCDERLEASKFCDDSLSSQLWAILGTETPHWLSLHAKFGISGDHLRSELRDTVELLVRWIRDQPLRRHARQAVRQRIDEFQPNVLCAHGFGSLVAYDALAHAPASAQRSLIFVAFGSPIGNQGFQAKFSGGRVARLPVQRWYHLYNRRDDHFTARIPLSCNNFNEIDAPLSLRDLGDRAIPTYLAHAAISENVWRVLLEPGRLKRSRKNFRRSAQADLGPGNIDLVS